MECNYTGITKNKSSHVQIYIRDEGNIYIFIKTCTHLFKQKDMLLVSTVTKINQIHFAQMHLNLRC